MSRVDNDEIASEDEVEKEISDALHQAELKENLLYLNVLKDIKSMEISHLKYQAKCIYGKKLS